MPAQTIDEVIDALDVIIANARKRNSPDGYFAALYRQVTKRVAERLSDGDYFDDNVRMERLDVIFANRYLAAYAGFAAGEATSQSWQLAFLAAEDSRPMVMQHLLLGMNAHIGLDLGVAAAKVAPGPAIQNLENDFMKINELLAAEVDSVQGALAKFTPFLGLIDRIGGHLDESMAKFSMDLARKASWQMSTELAAMADAGSANRYILERDRRVAGFSARLYQPKVPFRWLTGFVRWLEKGNVSDRIAALQLP